MIAFGVVEVSVDRDRRSEAREVESLIASARCVAGASAFEPRWGSLSELLHARASLTPDAPYLTFVDPDHGVERALSYREIEQRVAQAAADLAQRGVASGHRVALLLGNLDYAIILYLAVWALGACAVPLNSNESEQRKELILADSNVRLLVARVEWIDEARRLAASRGIELVAVEPHPQATEVGAENDVYPRAWLAQAPVDRARSEHGSAPMWDHEALVVYTSGTTGSPKGVVLDQYNLMASADALALWHGLDASTRMLCVLPIHHVNGLVVTHVTPLYVGGSTVLCARFSAARFWDDVARHGASLVSLVPTLLEFLLEASRTDTSKVAAGLPPGAVRVLCGAGPLAVETALAFESRFAMPLIHGYGLSESTAYNCQIPVEISDAERRSWLSEHGFPSLGCPLPHHEMAILGPDGRRVGEGERGEIAVRGAVISRGYLGRPDVNRTTFASGWLHTGDEGFTKQDSQGRQHFFISGRIKELIIRGGVNYSPLEIDEVLRAHPAVLHGLAIPFSNRWYGEEIAAYVVPRAGAAPSEDELLAHCRARLDFARCPKCIVFGTEIPYTTTGKARRLELARKLGQELSRFRETQFRAPRDTR